MDIMGIDILGIDIMGVGILGIDIVALPRFNNEHKRPFPLVFIIWFEWWTRLSFDLRHTVKKHIMK